MLELLKKDAVNNGAVIHCFIADEKAAKQFLDLGYFVGFTGIITFKNTSDLQQVVKQVPLEQLLIETDAPYLAPEPYRGQRNEPLYVEFVAKKVAELQGVSFEQVAEQTSKNAKKLFKLK